MDELCTKLSDGAGDIGLKTRMIDQCSSVDRCIVHSFYEPYLS